MFNSIEMTFIVVTLGFVRTEYLKFRKLLKNRSRLIRDTEDTSISKSACRIIQRGGFAFIKDLFHPR